MAELEATIAARRPLDWGATERRLWPKRPVRSAGAFFFLSSNRASVPWQDTPSLSSSSAVYLSGCWMHSLMTKLPKFRASWASAQTASQLGYCLKILG